MTQRDQLLARLVTMHAYCRPAGSPCERAFIERYVLPLGATRDAHGNYHVIVGDAPILWSCHTDTVHSSSGHQRVRLDRFGELTSKRSNCLGADDTAGVFLCHELIRRGIAGHYVFHYGEEKGCIGSHALAKSEPTWLTDIKYAIALDRGGCRDIITHQLSARTASDAFGQAFASALNVCGLNYEPSDRGVYTDTESYAHLIPECTNVSVGYFGAHGSAESLNTHHVLALLEALSTIDVLALPVDRDPSTYQDYGAYGYYGAHCLQGWPDDDDDDDVIKLGDRWYDRIGDTWIEREADMAESCYLDKVYGQAQAALRAQLAKIPNPQPQGAINAK